MFTIPELNGRMGTEKKNLDDLFLRFFFFFAGSSPSSLVKTEGSSADTGSPK